MKEMEVFFAGIVMGVAVGSAITAILLEALVPFLRSRFTERPNPYPSDEKEVGYETQPPRWR